MKNNVNRWLFEYVAKLGVTFEGSCCLVFVNKPLSESLYFSRGYKALFSNMHFLLLCFKFFSGFPCTFDQIHTPQEDFQKPSWSDPCLCLWSWYVPLSAPVTPLVLCPGYPSSWNTLPLPNAWLISNLSFDLVKFFCYILPCILSMWVFNAFHCYSLFIYLFIFASPTRF